MLRMPKKYASVKLWCRNWKTWSTNFKTHLSFIESLIPLHLTGTFSYKEDPHMTWTHELWKNNSYLLNLSTSPVCGMSEFATVRKLRLLMFSAAKCGVHVSYESMQKPKSEYASLQEHAVSWHISFRILGGGNVTWLTVTRTERKSGEENRFRGPFRRNNLLRTAFRYEGTKFKTAEYTPSSAVFGSNSSCDRVQDYVVLLRIWQRFSSWGDNAHRVFCGDTLTGRFNCC